MLFATPDDVTATQGDVRAQCKTVSDAMGDCIKAGKFSFSKGTPSDPTIGRDWKAFLKRAVSFLNEEPGWVDAQSQYDRGQRLLVELQPWFDRVGQAGCVAPTKPAAPPGKLKGEDWVGDYAGLIGLALIAFALHEAKGI